MNGPGGVPPPLDAEFTIAALGIALTQTLADAGRSAFVVGLSGGAASGLAAAIAVRAAGGEPAAVRAYFLPGPEALAEAAPAAEAVSAHLGIELETIPLAPLLDLCASPSVGPSRRSRLLARLRMALLYDRAAGHDALVLGTSSRSEIVLGDGTLWGDMAADCWPLGDLYRTQVVALARAAGIPAYEVIPACETELSYSAADRVLYYYLNERLRPHEIVERGLTMDLVDTVLSRVRSQAYKRRLPHVPKLSSRTVGHDFHHPRAWRGPA